MSNPKHIAIILDGNRRYGEKLGNRKLGHHEGAKRVEDLFNWCKELKIKELTLYTFSTENFSRPKDEVNYLMNLFRKQFKRLNKELNNNKEKIKVNFIGRLNLFPEDLQKEMDNIMNKTKQNNDFIVNFAVGYGSKAEIVDSVKTIINKGLKEDDINEKLINDNLYLTSEPDIMIRPGGEKRMSNFLLWQCAYSELFFYEKLWPEFTKQDLIDVIEQYKQRQRRFGK